MTTSKKIIHEDAGSGKPTRAHKRAAKKVVRATKKAEKRVKKEAKKLEKKARKVHRKETRKKIRHEKKVSKSPAHGDVHAASIFSIASIKSLGLANLLTIFRIFLIPFFILFFALNQYALALFTFALAGFTDMIDGTVARMRKEKSVLGAILDPFADKGLMLATFISLAVAGIVEWWFIYVILMRDMVVLSGFAYIRVKKIPFEYKALWSSKVATLFELAAGTLALVYMAFPEATFGVYPIIDIVYGTILLTAVLIIIATMQYLKLGMELLENRVSKLPSHA